MAKIIQRGISLFIDDKEIKNNVGSIKNEMRKIVNEQSKMTMGSKEYLESASRLKALNGIIQQHRADIGQIPTFWQKAKDTIISTGFGVLGGNMLTTIGSKIGGLFTGMIDGNAKLSDSFADIAKTTGMSEKEVEALNKSLGKIDTRTAVSDLRDIAIVAGQLGIEKSQVDDFTEAIDKINVALGDEIGGGAEGVADTVGKLRNVMGDMKTDNVAADLMHIGNALNTLGAAGFATSPVIADFSNRIGGIGIPLGLTSGQVMGLSATLQELNVSTERGGTAVGKILQKMTTNTGEFAKVAGINAKKFKDMVNTDLMGAFLAVVEGSNKSGDSATALAGIIKDLDVDGAGASEVFMKLGANVDMARGKIDLATDALTKNDSITSEFNIKNENFAAKWEKTKKMINGVVASIQGGLKSSLLWMIDTLQSSIKWVKRNGELLATMGRIIVSVGSVIATYITVSKVQSAIENLKTKSLKDWITSLKESVIVTKLKILLEKASRASSLLLASAQFLLAGNVKKAAQAFKLFSATLGASPWGIAAAAIVAIGAALYTYSKNQKESTSRLEEWGKANKDAYGELLSQENNMRSLGATVKNGNIAQEERNKALEAYNKIAIESNLLTLDLADSEDILNTKMAANLFMMEARIQAEIIENEIRDQLIKKREQEQIIAEEMAKTSSLRNNHNIDKAKEELKIINKLIQARENEAKGYKDVVSQIEAEVEKQRKKRAEKEAEDRKKKAEENKDKGGPADGSDEEKKLLEDLNKQIEKLQNERRMRRLSDDAREEEQIKEKYKELLLQAKNYAKQRRQLEELMESEIIDARIKKMEEKQKELRKKAIDAEKDLAKKIKDLQADSEPSELDIDLSNLDNKYSELLKINSDAINSIKEMGENMSDEDLVTLKKLYVQNNQLLDLWTAEEEKVRKKHADKQLKARQEVEDKIEDLLTTGNAKEVREIKKKYGELIEQAKKFGIDTTSLTKAMNDELDKLNKKTTASLFGMSETRFAKIKAAIDVIQTGIGQVADAWSAYNDLQKTKSDLEVAAFEKQQDKKKEALDKRLKKGLISQARYDKEMAAIDAETENRKKKAAFEEAKRSKKLKLFQAGVSMASAIVGFLADPGGYAGIALSAMAAIVGGLQIANIQKQDVAAYADGGFTNGDKIYRAGEKGIEHISPNWMVRHPVSGPIIQDLENMRLGKKTQYINPDFENINNSFSGSRNNSQNNYSSNQPDMLVASEIRTLSAKMEVIGNYLSDPNNRRAYMSMDDFKKTTKELALIENLSSYGLRKTA